MRRARKGDAPVAEATAIGGSEMEAPAAEATRRFRPPSRRTFVAMLGAAAAGVMLRDRLSGREVIRNPATGKPIWIGHV